jgi:LysM repeat protein
VQPGDSLEKIAAANNTTYLRLFYANTQIAQPDLIYPNQQLRVPEADEALTPRDLPTPAPAPAPVAAEPEAATPSTYRAPVSTAPAVAGGGVWDRLAACESGGNWAINTGNGFYGGLQFTLSSWHAVGGSGYPNQASRDEQIARAQILQSRGGWGNWPACASKLGLL